MIDFRNQYYVLSPVPKHTCRSILFNQPWWHETNAVRTVNTVAYTRRVEHPIGLCGPCMLYDVLVGHTSTVCWSPGRLVAIVSPIVKHFSNILDWAGATENGKPQQKQQHQNHQRGATIPILLASALCIHVRGDNEQASKQSPLYKANTETRHTVYDERRTLYVRTMRKSKYTMHIHYPPFPIQKYIFSQERSMGKVAHACLTIAITDNFEIFTTREM